MSQDNVLFGRNYAFELAPPGQDKGLRYGNTEGSSGPLRVSFDLVKNSTGTSNKSKVVLYNLAPAHRNDIAKGWLVRLQAGYAGTLDTVFVGNVFTVKSERNGADITTTLECGDGEGAITYSKLNKTYAGPVPLYRILQDAAQAMSLETDANPDPVQAGAALGLPDVSYPSFTAEGPARETLDKLLQPLGLEWSVQNGRMQILPITAHTGQQSQLVSPDTGLINLPAVDAKGVTSFTALLQPKLVPGCLVRLQSTATAYGGTYRIRSSKFVGDTHDKTWQVTCECATVPGTDEIQAISNSFSYQSAVA